MAFKMCLPVARWQALRSTGPAERSVSHAIRPSIQRRSDPAEFLLGKEPMGPSAHIAKLGNG